MQSFKTEVVGRFSHKHTTTKIDTHTLVQKTLDRNKDYSGLNNNRNDTIIKHTKLLWMAIS